MDFAPQPRFDDSAFKYVGGHPSINFVDTADHTARGVEADRFSSYARVIEWAQGAGVITVSEARAFSSAARAEPQSARRALRDAIHLRDVLERLFRAMTAGAKLDAPLRELNEGPLRSAIRELIVAQKPDGSLSLTSPAGAKQLSAPVHRVAWAAAQLLASAEVARLRRCEGPDCGWYYLDHSRNGFRRWCQMETCGVKMKSVRRAERRSAR